MLGQKKNRLKRTPRRGEGNKNPAVCACKFIKFLQEENLKLVYIYYIRYYIFHV